MAGQSLVSAVRTVEPEYQVRSLHGYFLRPGDATAPTVYIVERLRDGGSFVDASRQRHSARREHLLDVGVFSDRPERHRAPGRDADRAAA